MNKLTIEQDIWIRAYLAIISSGKGTTSFAKQMADYAIRDFNERFNKQGNGASAAERELLLDDVL